MIALLAVLRFILTFNEFDDIYLLTGGGAGTEVVSVRVYDLLTARGDVGAAAAQALVLALVLVVLVGLYLRFVGRRGGPTDRRGRDRPPLATASWRPGCSGCCGWVVIAVLRGGHGVPLLLHGAALGAQTWTRSCCTPGAVARTEFDLEHLRAGAQAAGRGRPGLPGVPAQQRGARGAHGGGHAAGGHPRRVRDQPAGVLRARRSARCSSPVYLFPAILLAVPLFVVFSGIGLRGSLVGLVIVYVAQTVPVSIYMLRNYFETVPVSLEEAAAIDGATRWTILRRISLPLAMPAVVVERRCTCS